MSKQPNNFNPENSFYQERIRQAKLAFNLLLGTTALSWVVSFAGVGLFLSGHLSEESVITIGGLLSNAAFAKLAKDANDRLDQSIREAIEEDEDV